MYKMIAKRLLCILQLCMLFPLWGVRIDVDVHEGNLREAETSDDGLPSLLGNLTDGINGEALWKIKETLTGRITYANLELEEKTPEQCDDPSACVQVFQADLKSSTLRQPYVSWNLKEHSIGVNAEKSLDEIAKSIGLVRGRMVLVRTTDGVFADDKTYLNPHGFWYIILPMYGCYNPTTKLLQAPGAKGMCGEGTRRRWYVFTATRGTQGLTETAADVGLYEKAVRKEFIGFWLNGLLHWAEWMIAKKHSVTGWISMPFRILAWPFLKLFDVSFDKESSKGIIVPHGASDLAQYFVYPEMQTLPANLREQGTPEIKLHDNAPDAVKQIRSWAETAVEKFKSDSTQLVQALLDIYGPGTTASTGDYSTFCENTQCPLHKVSNADTTLVFVGHSMGGAAATIQGVLAQQSRRVKVAVVTSSAPGVHDLSKALGVRLPRESNLGNPADPNQRYDKFVNFVPQHGIAWKVDQPLTEMGQHVCMYFHPTSQTRCAGTSDMGDIISASCVKYGTEGWGVKRRCMDYFSETGCWQLEHNWMWNSSLDIFERPVLGSMHLSTMMAATGKTMYSRTTTAQQQSKYDSRAAEIKRVADRKIKTANAERDTIAPGLSAKFARGGVIDLKREHCCEFSEGRCSNSQTYTDYKRDKQPRSPCNGAHMQCKSSKTFAIKRNTCWCENGYFYDPRTKDCSLTNTERLEALVKNTVEQHDQNVLEAQVEMKDELNLLQQSTDFGIPDERYGGELGGWFCTPPNDDSWRAGFRSRIFR